MKIDTPFLDIVYNLVSQALEFNKSLELNETQQQKSIEIAAIKALIDSIRNFNELEVIENQPKENKEAMLKLYKNTLQEMLLKKPSLQIEASLLFYLKKYNIPKEKLDTTDLDYRYVNEHFEEKDKLPFLESMFADAQLQYAINLDEVSILKDIKEKNQELIEAANNVVWYHHQVFLRCLWCEQYELDRLDYDTKKVRVKDSLQKIEAFKLEEEFKGCPEEIIKGIDLVRKWLKTHSKSLKDLDKDSYNKKIAESREEQAFKEEARNSNIVNFKEEYPNGFTFKDWENGEIISLKIGLEQGIITREDLERIRDAQKERYWQEVELRLERQKQVFQQRLEKSEAKNILSNNTIKYYEWYFDIDQSRQDELTQNTLENQSFEYLGKSVSKIRLRKARKFYTNHIVNGWKRNLDKIRNSKPLVEGVRTVIGDKELEELIYDEVFYRFYSWLTTDLLKNSKILEPPKKKLALPQTKENIETAISYVKFMSGHNYNNERIMNDKDYQRLIAYLTHLIEYETLPPKIEIIPQVNTSKTNIRYTFYLIHKALYTTNTIREYFIDFLHQVFQQFQNTEWKTTKTKFSVKPSQYDNDTKI